VSKLGKFCGGTGGAEVAIVGVSSEGDDVELLASGGCEEKRGGDEKAREDAWAVGQAIVPAAGFRAGSTVDA
jgi:hypothetical protein